MIAHMYTFFLQIVHKRLMGVLRHLTNQMHGGGSGGGGGVMWYPTKDISLESLVIGLKISSTLEDPGDC